MKIITLIFAFGTIILASCNSKSSIIGSWTLDNLNSVDASVNRETLLATFIVDNYTDKNILIFSSDSMVTMATEDGKELGKGSFHLVDSNRYVVIKFRSDTMESKYKILDQKANSLKLTATVEGETVNILLSR